jgi:hypothetical protein
MDWILDLLTICTHHLELHFTDHWHTQLSLLSLIQAPLAVSWKRLLTMEILQLPWSRRCPLVNTLHRNSQRNCRATCLQDNSSPRATQKTHPLYCCRCVFTAPLHRNGRGADHIENTLLLLLACMLRALPSNGLCLQSHCLATGLYVTILYNTIIKTDLCQAVRWSNTW